MEMTPSIRRLITVDHLCMDYDGKRVLDTISFTLAEGEVLGVIGRSGAGKSVLMHLLRGINDPPSAGSILYHVAICPSCDVIDVQSHAGMSCSRCGSSLVAQDIDIWNEKDEDLRLRLIHHLAIMFQRSFALYGNDRVIENVLHALEDIQYPPDQSINRAADLLDQVRLSHRMMHIARDLSGGEKQRVVLARQLAKEPFVLFADEPTGTLDPETSKIIRKILVESAHSRSMGMVVTSHFARDIISMANRAMLLVDGRIQVIGSPDEVVKLFLNQSSPPDPAREVPTGDPVISVRNVTKRYVTMDRGVIRAVNGVSFDIDRREIFGIVGKSGAGKTTLSGILSGVIEPTDGEVNVLVGDTWVDMTQPGIQNRGRAKAHIGLLHQEYDLFHYRTVLDNLTDSIGLEFPKELAARKASLTLQMAGFTEERIREILNRMPDQLSVGERHRVAFAQVLIREPRIVILDEPTGTMDPITKIDVKESILHAREEMDETFIIVSHDIEFVREICNRVVLMRGGKIIRVGAPDEVFSELTDEEQIPTGARVT